MSDSEVLRISISVGVLVLCLLLERALPQVVPPPRRIASALANIALGLTSALTARLLAPWAGVSAALLAAEHASGVIHWMQLSGVPAAILGFLLLDLAIYWQHRLLHTVPGLWRLHRVHHLETHLDATTALRFHPLEIAGSAVWRSLVIIAMGIPVAGVLIFEITVNATALFNHANLRLPPTLDRALRVVLVTPDLHRVHHSLRAEEQRSNYCFNMPWWDWLFGTYRHASIDTMPNAVGVRGREPPSSSLPQMLCDPLRP